MTPRETREASKSEARAVLARYEAEGPHNDRYVSQLFQDDPRPRVEGYTSEDLRLLYTRTVNGCWMWAGDFHPSQEHDGRPTGQYPFVSGPHARCGTAHISVGRAIFEDFLGRVLARNENVIGTCATNRDSDTYQRCVNPEHHALKEINS
jgi:hypothetical protein